MALCQVRVGNNTEAMKAAEHGVAAAASGFDRLMADLALGMTLMEVGDLAKGLERMSSAPWRSDRIGAFYFAYAGDAAYGRGLVRAGRIDEATSWLSDGVTLFEASGNRRGKCLAMLGLLEAAAAAEDAAEAKLWLNQIHDEAEHVGMRGVQAEAWAIAADLSERSEDLDAAIDRNTSARAIAGQLGWLALEQRLNAQARTLNAKLRS
jgi:tetratricopeptide (TPR) repeat protein